MKAWVVAVALVLCGCGQQATVLSNDGSKVLAVCDGAWMECISKACPDGYDIVSPASCLNCSGIVKCKQ